MTRGGKVAAGLVLVAVVAAVAVSFGPVPPPAGAHGRGTPIRIGNPPDGRVEKTDDEWRATLTPEQYRVTRRHGTERPDRARCLVPADGTYRCVGCGQLLFDTATKFNSGTGWPSFGAPVSAEAVSLYEDRTMGVRRVEVVCSRCDAHLGHVFDDGPPPTGKRYCLNGVALAYTPR